MRTQSRVQKSLRTVQLARGPQRQSLWKGMPITFVHGHHKGMNGYIKTAQEMYPPSELGPGFSKSNPHECTSNCAGCKEKVINAEHTCHWRCPGCHKARGDISRHNESLNDFLDIVLQVEISSGSIINASIREVRPSQYVVH